MGFMDKVKQQAGQLADKAQQGVKTGQAKLDAAQAKKRQDGLLRELGAAVYAERSGRASPETAGDIERLVGELRASEDDAGPVASEPTAASPGVAEATGAGDAGSGGDYTLDDV